MLQATPTKKITPALIAKDAEGNKLSVKEMRTKALRVIGRINGFSSTQKQFGDKVSVSTKFAGEFEATVIEKETGKELERYVAPFAFFPEFLDGQLKAGISKAIQESQALTACLEIALEITVKPRPDLAVGYEWEAKNLLPPQGDSFANLRKLISTPSVPALT